MIYISEAIEKLNTLTEDASSDMYYFDETTSKVYQIKDGMFVEVEPPKSSSGNSDQDKSSSTKSSGNPSINDIMNSVSPHRQIEDLLREIEDVKDRINHLDNPNAAESTADINDITDQIVNSAQDLDKEIDKLKKELDELKQKYYSKGGSFQDEIEEKEERLKEIEDVLHSTEKADEVMRETEQRVYERNQEKLRGEREAKRKEKYAQMSDADVLNLIKVSLSHTLKQEIIETKEDSWSKFNKKAYGAGLLRPGQRKEEKAELPSLNVYYDRSGSWGPAETQFGDNAINSIAYLAKKGKLKLRIFYFNDTIHNTDPGRGYGGTPAEPVFKHIRDTKPDNVFIMTDSDFDHQGGADQPNTTVPGAVWMVFKGDISETLQEKLHGKKFTKSFFIK